MARLASSSRGSSPNRASSSSSTLRLFPAIGRVTSSSSRSILPRAARRKRLRPTLCSSPLVDDPLPRVSISKLLVLKLTRREGLSLITSLTPAPRVSSASATLLLGPCLPTRLRRRVSLPSKFSRPAMAMSITMPSHLLFTLIPRSLGLVKMRKNSRQLEFNTRSANFLLLPTLGPRRTRTLRAL
ncbi:hypothetical protein I314_03619 [Cryptococcus bacillisporus CA1873]|uniref:Uncharacterized protein n=1 Tax=Cryptococcus bacillisporus CA1873 TaxID=1296111 RepID=A0ABR5B9R8_CRYGA|nr:hypothetical protein I314_03619 [Cryptococcus bacillisporus CA1873]|eukprot:KIR60328.1 hypothetical protein I314_03619 [Cryptococcus gattii CA1873]